MSSKSVRFVDASSSLINYATVPKNRKPKFELLLRIIDLNNVPLVTGTSFVKWHLPHSAAAEHRGKTPKALIKDHKVAWNYEKTLQVRVTADKNGLLQTTEIHFEVLQEYHSGPKAERITLGVIKLNLAEYVDDSYEKEEEVVRRYLMQESKINSTVQVSILMKQIEGERNFTAPPLRSGPMFGGIVGIMNQEQREPDDIGRLPTMPTRLSREAGEHQEIYRKTLAAGWSSQDLPADECIEDIFAGGDGWGGILHTPDSSTNDGNDTDDTEHLQVPGVSKKGRQHRRYVSRGRISSGARNHFINSDSGRATPENPTPSSSSDDRSNPVSRRRNEVSELEMREDLRSWNIDPPPD